MITVMWIANVHSYVFLQPELDLLSALPGCPHGDDKEFSTLVKCCNVKVTPYQICVQLYTLVHHFSTNYF